MPLKTRYDLMIRLLYPHKDNGKSMGYEQSQNGMTVSDWSPHNVRRLFISPHYLGVQFYVSTAKKPFRPVRSSIRISDEILNNEIQMIQNGEKVNGVLKALTTYKQFSDIQEIIFCNYEQCQSLLHYDLSKDIVKGLGGTADNFAENLKRKYPRLYQIGYSSLPLENIIKITSNEAKSLNQPLSSFDNKYQYAYKCSDNSCFKSKFIKTSDYSCDEQIDIVITKAIDEFVANEERKKKEQAEKEEPKSIDIATINELQSKYGATVSKLTKLISMVNKVRTGSPKLYSNLVTVSDDFVFGSFDLRKYLTDLLLRAKGSEKQKQICTKITNGGTKLPLFDIKNEFTSSLCKLVEFARFNFDIDNEDILTAVMILLLYCKNLLSAYINSLYINYDNSDIIYVTGFTNGAIRELLNYINFTDTYKAENSSGISLDDLESKLLALSKPKKENVQFDWSKFTSLMEIGGTIFNFEKSLSSYGKKHYMIQLLKDLPRIVTERLGVLNCGVSDLKDHKDIEEIVTMFKCNGVNTSYDDIDKFISYLKYYYISYCAYIVSIHLMKVGSLSIKSEAEKLKSYNLVYDDRVVEVVNKICMNCGKYLCMVATKVPVEEYEVKLDEYFNQWLGVLKEMIC